MHPDLAAHLHTPKCNELINLLKECHQDYPVRKFFGVCNAIDQQMIRCLKAERLARRKRNYEQSLELKKKLKGETL